MNDSAFERIHQEISTNEVVVFMRGTPMFPTCGGSAAVVEALAALGVEFKAVDVQTEPKLAEAISQFVEGQSAPQVYVRGRFIGGAEIIRAIAASGELRQFLAAEGIAVK